MGCYGDEGCYGDNGGFVIEQRMVLIFQPTTASLGLGVEDYVTCASLSLEFILFLPLYVNDSYVFQKF